MEWVMTNKQAKRLKFWIENVRFQFQVFSAFFFLVFGLILFVVVGNLFTAKSIEIPKKLQRIPTATKKKKTNINETKQQNYM